MAASRSGPNPQGPDPVIDPTAGRLLTLAVQADKEGRYMTACNLYTEGTQILYDGIRGISDLSIRKQLTVKAEEYLQRAEILKKIVDKEKEKVSGYHEQIVIEDGAVGYGLERVFGQYLDDNLTEVEIDDAYIRAPHQVQLFLRFCALLLKHAHSLCTIRLKTTRDPKSEGRQNQLMRLDEIRIGLLRRKISLFVEYSDTLHDREIRFNNGWLIKIGRGLDYFKRPEGQNTVDCVDLDFRQCLATTVDIMYLKCKTPSSGPPKTVRKN